MKKALTGISLGERFCRNLIDSMPSLEAKMILLRELSTWQGQTVYFSSEKRSTRRIKAARSMLDNGMPAAEAATAIHERYGITLRQAQRDVQKARNMS